MMTAETLKQSILELAMQGRLVNQIESEGSGKDLVSAVEETHRFKKVDYPAIAEVEKNYAIPDTWEWVRLENVAILYNGRAYKQKELLDSGKTPVLRVGNLFTSDKWYYSDLDLDSNKYCDSEDLIYSWSASFGPFIWKGGKVIYHYHIWKIEYAPEISRDYLYYFLMAETQRIKSGGHGLAMIHVTKAGMEKLLVPVPPLEEQKRIVAKIEELMPFVEQYAEASTKLNALNTSFPDMMKKSILQEAVQGKLVQQDPNDEPASGLLKRIAEEKERLVKEGKIKKQKALPEITEEEFPYEIPESWKWIKLGNLVQVNPRNMLDDTVAVGFMSMPLLEAGYGNTHSFEERKWGKVKSGFTHFANGDVVVAKITPCFQNRKSAVITNVPNGYGSGTTELHVFRDNTRLLFMEYLLLICKTDRFITEGVKNFTGTAGQQRVGKSFIENYPIPLPPIEEQKRIVSRVNEMLSLIDSAWSLK